MMRDLFKIQDELEAVAAERYACWSRGESAKHLDRRIDELFEEKRLAQTGSAERREEILRAALIDRSRSRERGGRPKPKPRVTTAERLAAAADRRRAAFEMFDAGDRPDEIAAELGVRVGTVYSMRTAWKKERAAAA